MNSCPEKNALSRKEWALKNLVVIVAFVSVRLFLECLIVVVIGVFVEKKCYSLFLQVVCS